MRLPAASRVVTLIVFSASAWGCAGPPTARIATPRDGGTREVGATPDGGAADRSESSDGANPDGPSLPPTAALRLIAPLSTATVTSQRPTFHWVLDPTCDGAHVQICQDRACTKQITAFDTTGTSGAPSIALPSGVLFWRAYGLSGSTIVEGWTPIWQLTVGARSAPVDTSWGTTLDVNGDGYADVAVGAPGTADGGQVNVYLGGPSGLRASADLVLNAPSTTTELGIFVASAGDVNGDGYADLVVGGFSTAYLYLGGPSGLAASPATTVSSRSVSALGVRVASAGDTNGDGYADVVIGYYDLGTADLYLGSAAGLGSSPALTLIPPPTQQVSSGGFAHSLAGAGDLNGDGYADLVIAAAGSSTTGQAFVYLGGASGLPAMPSFTLSESDGPGLFSVSSAGDVNGDGYADLVVGGSGLSGQTPGDSAGRAYIYLGGASGPATSPSVTLLGTQPSGNFGRSVSQAGDVNGDGYADVVVGADAESGSGPTPGWAYVYLGGAAGLSPVPAVSLTGPDGNGSWFGRCVSGAGDVNGDGYADVVIGADAGGLVAAGWSYVYLGGASGLAGSPAVRWVGPSSGSGFGRAVASLVRFARLGPLSL